MVRIKVFRLSSLIYIAVVVALLIAIFYLAYRLIIKDPVVINPILRINENDESVEIEDNLVIPFYKRVLAGGIPAIRVADEDAKGRSLFSIVFDLFTGKDIRNPKVILGYQMPYLDEQFEVPDNAVQVSKNSTFLTGRDNVDRDEIDPAETIRDGRYENNYEEVSDEIKILVEQIEVDEDPIELSGEGPKILIYHTHSREAYCQDPDNPYKEAAREAFRSNDMNHTVVNVGEVLAKQLNSLGIPALHDTTEHEQSDFNTSYSRSLKTIEKRMAEYDSLQMFIDIHRNAYEEGTKDPDEEVVLIDGERVAKLLVVIGTGEGVMGGYDQKPNWKENAKLAIKLTNKLNELNPGLAKDVYYRKHRFNQHVSTNSILVEVGSNFTTQNEAERSMKYLSEAISQIIE